MSNMTLARRSFLAAISAALLAPFAKPQAPNSEDFYAKVGPIVNGESNLTLIMPPSVTCIGISGDLSGLLEGDFIRFHIEKAKEDHLTDVVWKGRHIHVRNVELTP